MKRENMIDELVKIKRHDCPMVGKDFIRNRLNQMSTKDLRKQMDYYIRLYPI